VVPYTQKGGQGLDHRENRNDQKDEKQGMKCKVDGELVPLEHQKTSPSFHSSKTHYTTKHLTKCRAGVSLAHYSFAQPI
jgi:hypothetical protein